MATPSVEQQIELEKLKNQELANQVALQKAQQPASHHSALETIARVIVLPLFIPLIIFSIFLIIISLFCFYAGAYKGGAACMVIGGGIIGTVIMIEKAI